MSRDGVARLRRGAGTDVPDHFRLTCGIVPRIARPGGNLPAGSERGKD
jgi:hypothetical protein